MSKDGDIGLNVNDLCMELKWCEEQSNTIKSKFENKIESDIDNVEDDSSDNGDDEIEAENQIIVCESRNDTSNKKNDIQKSLEIDQSQEQKIGQNGDDANDKKINNSQTDNILSNNQSFNIIPDQTVASSETTKKEELHSINSEYLNYCQDLVDCDKKIEEAVQVFFLSIKKLERRL